MQRLIQSKLSRQIPTVAKAEQYEPFFRYTSGRWLWDEEKQLRQRYIKFNVGELKRIAAESIGAKSCVEMSKVGEGGYNKVFKLVMDTGAVAIARIPCPNAGPPVKTTASEVATMDFVSYCWFLLTWRTRGFIFCLLRLGLFSTYRCPRSTPGARWRIILFKQSTLSWKRPLKHPWQMFGVIWNFNPKTKSSKI